MPTSLFSIAHDPNTAANDLNNDLVKANDWGYQWKVNFNPDPFKQTQEVLFSRKIKRQNHPCLHLNNNPLRKHLGMYLDPKLGYLDHLKTFRPKWTNHLFYYGNPKLFSQDQDY